MSRDRYFAGVDIGSSVVRAVISENPHDGEGVLRILGVGEVPSQGLRKGVIVDIEEMAECIGDAIHKAEIMAGASAAQIAVNLGGSTIRTQVTKGVVAVGRADGEVSQEDIERVVAAAGEVSVPMNNEILHILPRSYRLDDQTDIKNPLSMRGVRLEVEALIVEGFTPQIKNLLQCLSMANTEASAMVFSPLAAAESTLTRRQKELGVVLVDIGATTTGIAVFEEGDLLHAKVLPLGAGNVTNDIAIGIRTSIDIAERVKLLFGTASAKDIDLREMIDLADVDSSENGEVYRHHVAEIIEARYEEIFDVVNRELKSIGREHLLPSGAVLVGGGAKIPGLTDLAKKELQLPVMIGYPQGFGGILDKVDNPLYAVATGLVYWQKNQDGHDGGVLGKFGSLHGSLGSSVSKAVNWAKRFLP